MMSAFRFSKSGTFVCNAVGFTTPMVVMFTGGAAVGPGFFASPTLQARKGMECKMRCGQCWSNASGISWSCQLPDIVCVGGGLSAGAKNCCSVNMKRVLNKILKGDGARSITMFT